MIGSNASLPLTTGGQYTISYTITLTAAGTLSFTNSLYSGVGTSGTPLFTQTGTTNYALATSFDGLAIAYRNSGSSLNPIMDVTSISLTESIAGMPGQPFNVTGGGTACIGSSFPVGLNGSVTSNSYYLYTNGVWTGIVQPGTGSAFNFGDETILAVPLTNTVVASNTISSVTGSMLNSVVVAPFALPVITNQPAPAIVANGSVGVFSVGASGGGLTYQWYKNGHALTDGGNISGSLTSTLVISPAGSGDVASYYCTITDGCDVSTNSTTNGLSLDTPANLTWLGGNPNTNWDLSTTPNFRNGSAVVFHNGDNVTFDDTSAYPKVNISGSYIAPTLITESANQSYLFSGSGHIIGSGALVMNGPGNLSINNSNAYTGGTTINGGTLLFSNLNAFGIGNIDLTGGTFDVPTSPGSSTGLSNNIDVTGNATLEFDQSGTYACVLNGNFSGNANATLTLYSTYATSVTTARLRLYQPFTNNANIVMTSAGSTETELAPYAPSNNQVFNGVISGTVGHLIPRGAGSVILNNTNTFNDSTALATGYSTLVSSGNVGIGADSVSSSPPTIDSSPVGTGMVGINVGAEGGNCSIFASGGSHTIANQFQFTSTTNTVTLTFGGVNDLTLSGEFDIAIGSDTFGTNRTLNVTNTGATTLSGLVADNGLGGGIIKTGSGALYLNGADTYSGPTTNTAGLLAGSGSIAGLVDVETNGSIGGGAAYSIGTLTISNTLRLNGNVFVRVDKNLSPAQSNDMVSVTGTLSSTGIGTVTVTNIGVTALVVGDRLQIFNGPVSGASTMTVSGGIAGAVWTNRLGLDGSVAVVSIGSTVATNPTNITFSVSSGTNLLLSWPGDHLGWTLVTNSVGLTSSSNWFPYPGSAAVTNENIIIGRGQSNVFFRLVYPYP